MKKFLLFILILVSVACSHRQSESHTVDFSNTEQLGEPKILDELLSSREKYKRYDLVDHLYKEAVKKDAQLSELDRKISAMEEIKNKGLAEYDEFIDYNNSFYNSASGYLNSIQDSSKREVISKLLDDSKSRYNNNIGLHKNAFKQSYDLESVLNDQLILIKLVVSENLIFEYQKSLPEFERMRKIIEQYEGLIIASNQYVSLE